VKGADLKMTKTVENKGTFAERLPLVMILLVSLFLCIGAVGIEVTALHAAGYTTILDR
jgi:hypothetical protein